MYLPPGVRKRIWIACGVAPFLLPGWRGDLVPVPHDDVIVAAGTYDADEVFGTSLAGEREGEEWHAQFMGSPAAEFFDFVNLRKIAPHLVPPAYVAHFPPGTALMPVRADAYFKVETHWRWPWWWPGGGVRWEVPQR